MDKQNKSSNAANPNTVKGQIISGEFGKIIVRKKSDIDIELGELVIADTKTSKILLQVYDLMYGSQISQQNLELISGLNLEQQENLNFLEPNLRNYMLALLKPLIATTKDSTKLCKMLPDFFSTVKEVTSDDMKFITKPKDPLMVGKLRSGSKVLNVDVSLPGTDVFSHHILIPATTGRGKSNLTSVMLWDQLDKDYCGILVLDPHDEYYGREAIGLKDHGQQATQLSYYTPKSPPPGTKSLKINIRDIRPSHFNGVTTWSMPQLEAMSSYYKEYGKNWIEAAIQERKVNVVYHEGTLSVLKRRLLSLLNLEYTNNQLYCSGIFDLNAGQSTISDICTELESGKTVIIDTSSFSGAVEILIGGLISTEIFRRYKNYKMTGELKNKPVISIILEEAPRVLGKEVLERGSNIFSTIAREGRKFKVGLTAITQLPSLIPRQILANMNTKIILGIEMAPERQAIIDSASQDLSTDNRNIASLDKGEAIITSNFTKFATPIKVPLFKNIVEEHKKINQGSQDSSQKATQSFSGITL